MTATSVQLALATTATRTGARVAVAAAAGAGLFAAVLHLLITPEHMMEYVEGNVPGWLPLAFAVSVVAGLAWAASLAWTGSSPTWLAVGAALNGVMFLAGLASRTVGLPGAEVEDPSALWAAATAAEGAALVVCSLLLAWRVPAWRPRPAAAVTFAVVGLAVSLVFAAATADLSEVLAHAKMLAAVPSGLKWK